MSMTNSTRRAWGGLLLFAAAALVIGALVTPFRFESSTLFYKFGTDKTLLRAGKLMGILAAMLMLFQLPLAARFRFLDELFSLNQMLRLHRIHASIIVILVLTHPACILISDDMIMIPLKAKYWPEWVGAGLSVLLLFQVISSRWRRPLSIAYHRWIRIHRTIAVAIVTALLVHVLFVSETFEQEGIPRTALLLAGGGWIVLWIRTRSNSRKVKMHPYRVDGIRSTGKDAFSIDLIPSGFKPFSYTPGQFAFFTFDSPALSGEAHPFTLSSSPSRPESVQITVRRSGDWTENIGAVENGDAVYIQGPYGRFSALLEPASSEILMIAGGIGITPMLSMLRYMGDNDDSRPVTLLWSNRSLAFLFGAEELNEMQRHLTRFRWIPIFTREPGEFGRFGRLDAPSLKDLLEKTSRDATVFICGPPEMIWRVKNSLINLGFKKRLIRHEAFIL